MKKLMLLLIVCMLTMSLTACSSDDTDDYDTNSVLNTTQMQDDPMSFTGQISVEGIVGNYGRFNFSISDGEGIFELAIDYRGNQQLPELGTNIIVTGQMNYRRCCGPHIIATQFEAAQ